MSITEALKLKVGDNVSYPSDRGDPADRGTITHLTHTPRLSFTGEQYIWASLKRDGKSCGVWPTNRISHRQQLGVTPMISPTYIPSRATPYPEIPYAPTIEEAWQLAPVGTVEIKPAPDGFSVGGKGHCGWLAFAAVNAGNETTNEKTK